MRLNLKLPLMILLLSTISLMAETTGKLAGKVFDKNTGEPLPGANILVVGTEYGSASNFEGEYTILNLRPGTYTIKARFVGYAPMTVKDVKVYIGLTTRIDFPLTEETIQSSEVVIIAKRNVIKKDLTTSVSQFSSEEVNSLPVTNLNDVIGLQAGITDGLSIRGGGEDEALYMVNGATQRDPRNNEPITGIALSAVKAVSVERGGFNAEYGQVRSGIINVVTKEGDKNRYEGDIILRMSPPAKKFFDISPFDPKSPWLRPYLDDDVCWTGTENGNWDYFMQRQYPKFIGWNEISKKLMENNNPNDDLSPKALQRLFKWQHRRKFEVNKPDYDIDFGFGGPVPFISKQLGNLRFYASYKKINEMLIVPLTRDNYSTQDFTMQLNSEISKNIRLKAFATIGNQYTVANNGWATPGSRSIEDLTWVTDYMRSPDEIGNSNLATGGIFSNGFYSLAQLKHKTLAVKLTHMLSDKTFYEFSLEHVRREYKTEPDRTRDTSRIYEIINNYFVDEAPFGWYWRPDVSVGDNMTLGGEMSTSRDYSTISSTTLKFDLSSQMNFNNLVKTGFEFTFYDLIFDYGIRNLAFPESNTWTNLRKFPYQGALYIQDKLEAEGFILNVGLRADINNGNTEWVKLNPYDEYYSGNYRESKKYKNEKTKTKINISPRLGISHPITETSKLYFNYGHFQQLPSYEEMFLLHRGATNQINRIGNPNLRMAKTISYELGYDQVLFGDYLLQLAGFYHDIKDQISFVTYYNADKSIIYDAAVNNSYEDISGFEITFNKQKGKYFTFFANYTYQVNSSGFFGTQNIYEDPSEQRIYNMTSNDHYQYKPLPQPFARVNLTFKSPEEFGPKLVNEYILGNWKLNILSEWNAGYYMTWNPKNIQGITYNLQTKDYYNIDLRLSKSFELNENVNVTILMDISNLFNIRRLNLNNFWDYLDETDYFNSLHLPKSKAYDNIVGNDKPGDYRKPGVKYQPIVQVKSLNDNITPKTGVIYYVKSNSIYMNFENGKWKEVDKGKMDKILEDKAYIDMPNRTSFNFLNPRDIYFGIKASIKL